jgi:ferredoxin
VDPSLWSADYHGAMSNRGEAQAPITYEVLLRPSGRSFRAPADRPLLQAAELAGIALPNSCRNGTCRTCLRPLHAGAVHYRIPWPGLLPEEKNGGWVLPCVAFPQADLVLGDDPAQ